MFSNIAPVSPTAALAAIEHALASPNAHGIADEAWRRDRIALLLRSIAYDAELFNRSATALLLLALAECSEARSRPVEQALEGLFHIILSGTHATIEQRIGIVDALLRSAEPPKHAIGIKLLIALLQTNHFSSGYSFEFGARPRDYGYWPKTWEESQHWFVTVLKMAGPIASSDLPTAQAVRSESPTHSTASGLSGPRCRTSSK